MRRMLRLVGFALVFFVSFAVTLYLIDNDIEAALEAAFKIAGL